MVESVPPLAGARCVRGRHVGTHLDEALTARVRRHDQRPAGPDQALQRQLRPVRLRPTLVELEHLPIADAGSEVALGDVPQAVVVATLGRHHHVLLRAVRGGRRLTPGGRGPGPVRLPGRRVRLPDRGHRDLVHRTGDRGDGGRRRRTGRRVRALQPVASGGQQQHGRHQPASQVLLRGGRERHPPRQAAAPDPGHQLDDQAGHQLRPGQPDDADDDVEHELDRHLPAQRIARDLRDRVADDDHQRDRDADHDAEQQQRGDRSAQHVASAAHPARALQRRSRHRPAHLCLPLTTR